MVAFLSELNGLDLWATNIGNAYLEAKTPELLFIVAGPEFGDLEGHMLIIYKALYGLCSSGLRSLPALNLEILKDICSLSIECCMDFIPQAYAGMNASQHVFETWASSLARPNQISG
jgi:hypothetical protein